MSTDPKSYSVEELGKLEDLREVIERDLVALDFVKWDRFCITEDSVSLYGWIEREKDDRSDFALLITTHRGRGFITSSAKYHDQAKDILFGTTSVENGVDRCVRVENHFPGVENVARLTA